LIVGDDNESDAPGDTGDAKPDAATEIMAELLGQSRTAVGEYLEPNSFFEKLREAEIKAQWDNVAVHIKRVASAIDGSPRLTPAQTFKFRSWASIAANIPPTDAARSAIIEAALRDLLETSEASEFEEPAAKLTDRSARLLLTAPADFSIEAAPKEERSLAQLAALRLVSRPSLAYLLGNVGWSIVGAALGLGGLWGLVLPLGSSFLPRYIPASLGSDLIIDTIIVTLVIAVSAILVLARKYQITEFGKSVQAATAPFYKPTFRKRGLFASAVKRPLFVAAGLSLIAALLPVLLQVLPTKFRYNQGPSYLIISSAPSSQPGSPNQPPPVPAERQAERIDSDDLPKLIGVWRSVANQLGPEIEQAKALRPKLTEWKQFLDEAFRRSEEQKEQLLKDNQDGQSKLISDLNLFQDQAVGRRVALDALSIAYRRFPNVPKMLDISQTDLIANRYQQAKENFVRELSGLHSLRRFDETISPFVEELDGAITALTQWAVKTRDFANTQVDELSSAPVQSKN
jgi:hypothetical protein